MLSQDGIKEKYKIGEVESILKLVETSIDTGINKHKIDNGYDLRGIILFSAGKCLVTLREIIVLCINGLPDGALSLARNVYEQFNIVSYLKCHEDDEDFQVIIDRYNADYDIKRQKALKFYYSNLRNNDNEIEECKSKIKEIEEKYEKKVGSDYWWSGCNSFADIIDDVIKKQDNTMAAYLRNLQLLYKRACLSHHASCMGNAVRLGKPEADIDLGPWDTGEEVSLYLALASFLVVECYLAEILEFDNNCQTAIRDGINKLLLVYDKQMKEE